MAVPTNGFRWMLFFCLLSLLTVFIDASILAHKGAVSQPRRPSLRPPSATTTPILQDITLSEHSELLATNSAENICRIETFEFVKRLEATAQNSCWIEVETTSSTQNTEAVLLVGAAASLSLILLSQSSPVMWLWEMVRQPFESSDLLSLAIIARGTSSFTQKLPQFIRKHLLPDALGVLQRILVNEGWFRFWKYGLQKMGISLDSSETQALGAQRIIQRIVHGILGKYGKSMLTTLWAMYRSWWDAMLHVANPLDE